MIHRTRRLKKIPSLFPDGGLVDFDEASIEGAGADGGVVSVVAHGREEFLSLLDRRREVGVAKQRNFAARFEHAVAHAVSLSPVGLVRYQPQFAMLFPVGVYDRGGAIGGTIINDKDFGPVRSGLQVGEDALDRFRKAAFLVVCRDNDGEVQRRRIHL